MEEIKEYLELYRKKFGEALPTYQITRGRTSDEIIKIINNCIKKNKDVYQLGYATIDDDVMY